VAREGIYLGPRRRAPTGRPGGRRPGAAVFRPRLGDGRAARLAPRRDRPQGSRPRRDRGGAARHGRLMHLLATEPGIIADGSAAVDLAQTPGNIVVLTACDT